VVLLEITPKPSEAERKAIAAALAAEESQPPASSEWNAPLLPSRDEGEP
jgi:hypothetical protein